MRMLKIKIKNLKMNIKQIDQQITVNGQSITSLNVTSNGVSRYQRIGSRIIMKKLMVRGVVQQGSTTNSQQGLRVAIVYDVQSNGANAIYSDMFGGIDQSGATFSDTFSPLKYENDDRFILLDDQQLWLPDTRAAATNNNMLDTRFSQLNIQKIIHLNVSSVYAPGATQTAKSGNLMLVLQNQGVTTDWTFEGVVSLVFKDE